MNVVNGLATEMFTRDTAGVTFTRLFSKIDGEDVTWSPTFTDLLNGRYLYTYVPAQSGSHSWLGSGSDGDDLPINFEVLTANQLDPVAALGSSRVTVVAPVAADSRVTIVRGDDYLEVDDRALSWVSSGWPDLTGATIELSAKARYGAGAWTSTGSVITPSGSDATVHVDILATDTEDKTKGNYDYDLKATLADDSIVTLARGTLLMLENIAALVG